MSVLSAVIIVSEVCIPEDDWLIMGEDFSANMCVSVS